MRGALVTLGELREELWGALGFQIEYGRVYLHKVAPFCCHLHSCLLDDVLLRVRSPRPKHGDFCEKPD